MKRSSRIVIALIAAFAVLGTVGPAALAAGGNNNSSNNSNNNSNGSSNTSANATAPGQQSQQSGLASGSDCYTAVYDQQDNKGTTAHYGKGEWDADRQLCMHVDRFTQSFLRDTTAINAAQSNPFVHVMYVIDRTQDKLYAPCGANTANGILTPGTYDLNSLTKIDSGVPSLGAGANCLITG